MMIDFNKLFWTEIFVKVKEKFLQGLSISKVSRVQYHALIHDPITGSQFDKVEGLIDTLWE